MQSPETVMGQRFCASKPPTCTFYETGTSRTTQPQITALTATQYHLICSGLRAHRALPDMVRLVMKIRDVNTSGPSKRHYFAMVTVLSTNAPSSGAIALSA